MLGANLRPQDDYLRRKGQQSGSIQRRGDKWHIFFRQLTADDQGNTDWKLTSREVGPATGPERLTKREALKKGQQDHVNRANGLTITPGGMATMEQFIDARYRPDHIKALAASADYESIIRCHILPSLGHCQLRDISYPQRAVVDLPARPPHELHCRGVADGRPDPAEDEARRTATADRYADRSSAGASDRRANSGSLSADVRRWTTCRGDGGLAVVVCEPG